MRYVWPDEAVVPLVDLGVRRNLRGPAAADRLAPDGRRFAGPVAAALLLLLGNPAFTRLGGVRIRAQGEAFIAVLVTAAVYAAIRGAWRQTPRQGSGMWPLMLAGAIVGAACLVRYQAAIYLAVVWAIIWLPPSIDERVGWMKGLRIRGVWWSAIGFVLPLLAMFILFALRGALVDLLGRDGAVQPSLLG